MDNHTTQTTDTAVFKPFTKQQPSKSYTHQWTITLHRLLILLYSNHLQNNNYLRATLTSGQSHYTDYRYCFNQTIYKTTTIEELHSAVDNQTTQTTDTGAIKPCTEQQPSKSYTHLWTITLHRLQILL